MSLYQDPIIKAYKDLIEAKKMPFRAIYQGDQIVIPQSHLPALIIAKSDTQFSHFTNAEDRHQVRMVMTVVTDIRAEITDDTKTVAGIARLYELIEARNEDFTLKEDCILSILRSNANIDPAHNLFTDVESVAVTSFGTVLGRRDKEAYSVESQITFTADFTQVR